jgi:alpha-ketoglutarate-dependent taurine dioxygenase
MTIPTPDMLPGPVTDRSAWKGADMMKDDSWIYRLNEREIAEIESAFTRLAATAKNHDQVQQKDFPLETFGRLVTAMRDQIEDGRGVTLLKGVPIAGKTVEQVELLYEGISAHIGTSVVQDTEGTLTGRVEDRGNNYQDIKVRGTNTNAQLTPHCDSADILALLCVRQAKSGGVNTLASSMAIYNEILARHEQFIEPLYNGFHYNIRGNGPPVRYRDYTAHRVPVYSYYKGKLSCRFNQKAILTSEQVPGVPPLTQLEKDAVNAVAELSMRPELSFEVLLEPGDLLLLSNYSVFHNRDAFEDWDEPHRKRLLLRKWINIPNARELTWEFADHYNTGPRQGPYVAREPAPIAKVA